MSDKERLLALVEQGGYPNFRPLYEELGFDVRMVTTVRKALAELRSARPAVVIAEFNYQSDFRDRTSSLESLLAAVQRDPAIRTIVFYDREYAHQLDKLKAASHPFVALPFPIDTDQLRNALQ